LEDYNSLPQCGYLPFKISRSEAVNLQSPVWLYLTSEGNPTSESQRQRRLVDNFLLQKRAEEEIAYVRDDVSRMKGHLVEQLKKLAMKANSLLEEGKLGQAALLKGQILSKKASLEQLNFVCSDVYVEPAQFSKDLLEHLREVEKIMEGRDLETPVEEST
jgi:hypothetical protein